MAAFTNDGEDDVLLFLFHDIAGGIWTTFGATAAGTNVSLYLSLHIGDPGEGGDQTTSETGYTNYARVAVPRAAANWTHASGAGTMTNATQIVFPTSGGAGDTVTHVGAGTSATLAGRLFAKAALTSPSISTAAANTPQFQVGNLVFALA
jgi:hypothetical protein